MEIGILFIVFFFSIEAYTDFGIRKHSMQFNYFSYNFEKVVSPYLEITYFHDYIQYLEYVF